MDYNFGFTKKDLPKRKKNRLLPLLAAAGLILCACNINSPEAETASEEPVTAAAQIVSDTVYIADGVHCWPKTGVPYLLDTAGTVTLASYVYSDDYMTTVSGQLCIDDDMTGIKAIIFK